MEEQLLKYMETMYDAKDLISINDALGLKSAEALRELQDTLNNLVDRYIVFKTKKDKYILLKNCPNLKIGKFSANKKGFGFVILNKEDDLYIGKEDMNGAIQDDIVLAEVIRKGVKPEGHIIRIIKRDLHNLVGEIIETKKGLGVKLDEEKLDLELKIDKDSLKNCVPGHKVLIKLVKELGKKRYLAKIIKILGHKDDPGMDILSIAYKYQIDPDFGSEVEEELQEIPTEVKESELISRRDLTNWQIFTIDGDHTKDIDDAISLTKEEENYILGEVFLGGAPSGESILLETGAKILNSVTNREIGFCANNIYDLAGNCYEWTQEAMGTHYRVGRGGCYTDSGSTNTASARGYNIPIISDDIKITSRVSMYIK